jgi:hypothetical protein
MGKTTRSEVGSRLQLQVVNHHRGPVDLLQDQISRAIQHAPPDHARVAFLSSTVEKAQICFEVCGRFGEYANGMIGLAGLAVQVLQMNRPQAES